MTGPENETPSRSSRPKSTSEPAAAPAAPAAEPAPAAPAAQPATAQASAAVSSAMTAVRERLQVGEQILLVGAALIVAVYVIFQVILGHRIFLEAIPVVVAVLAVLAIWVHRWGHHDFGSGYRILLGALGVSLLLFAFTNFLTAVRFGLPNDGLFLLGLLLYWAGGAAALYGGWLVFRSR
jgi:hypothetical protein